MNPTSFSFGLILSSTNLRSPAKSSASDLTIADFPIPVITGIGHSTNFTVSEQVSFVNKITPTEVGYYLIQRFHNLSVRIKDMETKLLEKITGILSHNREILKHVSTNLKVTTERLVYQNNFDLNGF